MRERNAVVFAMVLAAAQGGLSRADDPPPRASGSATVADPGTRFKFIERYATEPDKTKPEVLSHYRVAVLETIKGTTEKAQGAPDRSEIAFRTIYTERPARVGSGAAGDVLDAVRHYDTFRPVPDRSRPVDARPLEGLTVWYHPRISDEPQILSLTERELTEKEYLFAARQMFLPDLRGLLPSLASRVGDDPWPIPASAARALLCDPSARGRSLSAKLVDVREVKASDGRAQWVAVIAISGRTALAMTGDTAVSAELDFTFTPPPPAGTGAAAKQAGVDKSTVDARGSITELRMALSATSPISADPKERLRHITTREYVLQRRPAPDGAAPLRIPSPPPTPNEANSWLTLVPPPDPKVPRFTFRHPQELLPPPSVPVTPSEVALWDRWPDPRDELSFTLTQRTGKPEVDRQFRDPEFHRKQMLLQWEKDRLEVVQGPHEWLPATDWTPHNMKVYRLQAALKETRKETRSLPRSYIDFYLVLFGRDE
ncbi:MAG: hypothetical protein P4L84_10600, partial [Isosphaeraceae bacterium]|nr:hypothetical protein [Isosphaeraceae bacterium]